MAALFVLMGALIGALLGIPIGGAIGYLIHARPRRDYPWNWRALVGVNTYFDWLDSRP